MVTAVSNLQVIKAQSEALAKLGAVTMEEERAEAERRLTALIGGSEP